MTQDADAAEIARLRLERELFLRLLDLGHAEDLRPFLERALAVFAEITGAQRGYIELYAAGAGATAFHIASGFEDAELPAIREALSKGIIREALATGRVITTSSAVSDPRFKEHESVQLQRIESVLCAPIGHPAIGVLYLAGRARSGPFADGDRSNAELVARHVAPLAERLLARDEADRGADHTAPFRAQLKIDRIAGRSRALAEALRMLAIAAQAPLPALFTGESGTGKSCFARAMHDSSTRARGPFVEINCAAIPEALFESELFGAEKGAHSTATRRLDGKVDAARGGTLFLDEIGEMPLALQSKLLMLLQSKKYYRLGSTTPIDADVRFVAATNANLDELVRAKRFREDLFYRLGVLDVRVPPLRERVEDVVPIADAIVSGLVAAHDRATVLTRGSRIALEESEWPGNVRQLENTLQRGWAIAVAEGSLTIEPRHLFPAQSASASTAPPEDETYEDATRRFQRTYLERALTKHGWNVSETARQIGMARSHLNDLIRAHGLTRDAKR